MKLYRLKKEARPFFPSSMKQGMYTSKDWLELGVHLEALEEVQPPVIVFGIKVEETEHGSHSMLSGWDKDKSRFSFTIHFRNIDYKTHSKMEKDIPLIIEKVQELLIEKFKEYEE